MGRLSRLFDTGIAFLEGIIERIGDPDLVRCSRQRHLRIDSEWVTIQERVAALEDQLDSLTEENESLRQQVLTATDDIASFEDQLERSDSRSARCMDHGRRP